MNFIISTLSVTVLAGPLALVSLTIVDAYFYKEDQKTYIPIPV